MSIERVLRAVGEGRLDVALAQALAEWRRRRAPEIATAIDVLDTRALRGFKPPAARNRVDFQAAWLKLANGDDVVATSWLASMIAKLVEYPSDWGLGYPHGHSDHKLAQLVARLERLRVRGPDPRLARAALALLQEARIPVGNYYESEQVYGRLIGFIEAAKDVRALAPLEQLHGTPTARVVALREFLAKRLPKTIAKLRAHAQPLAAKERAAWQALATELGGGNDEHARGSAADGEALLARIRERPDDHAARLVYADWLSERGDAQGEFIVLQDREARDVATEKELKRMRSLQRTHKDAWLGPLAPVLRGVEFERGFLARAELVQNRHASPAGWHAAAQDPRLATLKHLGRGLGNGAHYVAFMLSPSVRALESVELLNAAALEKLLRRRPLRLVQVMLAFHPSREQLRTMAAHRSFAELQIFEPSATPHRIDDLFADLRATGWLDRIGDLRLHPLEGIGEDSHDEIFAHWRSLPKTLRRLAVVPRWGEVSERNRR